MQKDKLPPQPRHTLMPFLQLFMHPKHRCHKITKQNVVTVDLPEMYMLQKRHPIQHCPKAPSLGVTFVHSITSSISKAVNWQRNLLPENLMVWIWRKIVNAYCTGMAMYALESGLMSYAISVQVC